MIDTNDVFENAVRGSTLHSEENGEFGKSLMGSKIVSVVLLAGIAYVGFNYYTQTMSSEPLVVKKEVVAKIQIKPELIATVDVKPNSSEEAYLNALKSIESELTEERETVDLDTKEQMSLSAAMNDLIEETTVADNTTYAKELKKEIGVEEKKTNASSTAIAQKSVKEKARKIIVQKGDTLRGLSSEFYGDPKNYKRIIASNDSLNANDTIYVGQTILLPY